MNLKNAGWIMCGNMALLFMAKRCACAGVFDVFFTNNRYTCDIMIRAARVCALRLGCGVSGNGRL